MATQNQSSDIEFSPQTNDIVIRKFRLPITTGNDAIRQRLNIKLKIFLGEWFLNRDIGVDYYGVILTKNPNVFLVEALLRAQILGTIGVNRIIETDLQFGESQRNLSFSFKVNTNLGDIEDTIEVTNE